LENQNLKVNLEEDQVQKVQRKESQRVEVILKEEVKVVEEVPQREEVPQKAEARVRAQRLKVVHQRKRRFKREEMQHMPHQHIEKGVVV